MKSMKIIKQDLEVYIYQDKGWFIEWLKNNLLHREDGPAEIWSDGDEYYYLNNKNYFKDRYWKEVHENY